MANEHDDDYHADDGDFCDRMQPGDRMISYNLPKAERPDGLKVRFKVNVVSGPRAREIDARQAAAIMTCSDGAGNTGNSKNKPGRTRRPRLAPRAGTRPPARRTRARNETDSACQEKEKARKYKAVIRREPLIMPG